MTWFKVDDSFYDHPKVFDASDAAVALWTRAGSWSARNLTDGFVPSGMLARLSTSAEKASAELVTRGLWKKARGGYRFHDWGDFNPKRTDIQEERKAARERMRKLRDFRKAAGHDANGSPEHAPNVRGMFAAPTRPDPTRPKGGSSPYVAHGRARDEPPPKCGEHLDDPNPPACGQCADARRANGEWHAYRARLLADATQCRRHRGQPAHNCAPCRSEQLATKDDR